MAYKALYRTYRPLTFLEVAGQKTIVRTLQNALANNKVAHAYLFAGPRGTGKTTMAKLMAKALNCEKGVGHQCNECENCLAINNNSHPDVIEIDAASNNGVDEVRSLVDNVSYLPIKGRYKVYIIDEVHMMTTGAFNALLKTLEEPPAHIVFILATTEAYKIIPTIISRTQRYDFAKVGEADIKERLLEVLKKENAEYDIEAIDEIITLSDGGVRDALSLLDQALSYAGGRLVEQDIVELFGLVGLKDKISLLVSVARGEGDKIISSLNQFTFKGADLKRLVTDLLDILKDLLIFEKTNDRKYMKLLKQDDAIALINEIGLHNLEDYIDGLLKVQNDFKTVSNMRLLLEIVLLRFGTDKKEPKPFAGPETKKTTVPPIEKTAEPAIKPVEKERPAPKLPEDDLFDDLVGGKPNLQNNIPVISRPVADTDVKEPAQISPGSSAVKDAKPLAPSSADKELESLKSLIRQEKKPEGEGHIEISDEDLIRIMVHGNKEGKQLLINDWNRLNALLMDGELGEYAVLLKDGRPLVLSKKVLILEYDVQSLVGKANLIANQKPLAEILRHLFGLDVNVFAIPRKNGLEIIKTFRELSQLNKLPKGPEEITIKGLSA